MNLFLRFLFMGAVCLLPLVGCSDDDTEGTGPEPTSDFQFETLELTQGSFKVKITPEDKNMTYFSEYSKSRISASLKILRVCRQQTSKI